MNSAAPEQEPGQVLTSDEHVAGSPEAAADPPAWGTSACHLLLWGTAGVGLAADLISKHLAFEYLPSEQAYEVIRNVLSLQRSLNLGALFGIGRGMTAVFIFASILAVGFVLYVFRSSRRSQWAVHLGLGLVLAGALGNLYDRLFVRCDVVTQAGTVLDIGVMRPSDSEHGFVVIGRYPDGRPPIRRFPGPPKTNVHNKAAVRDFIRIDLMLKRPLWPWIFNLADVMLVIGVSLLVIIFWRKAPVPDAQPSAAEAQVDPPSEVD